MGSGPTRRRLRPRTSPAWDPPGLTPPWPRSSLRPLDPEPGTARVQPRPPQTLLEQRAPRVEPLFLRPARAGPPAGASPGPRSSVRAVTSRWLRVTRGRAGGQGARARSLWAARLSLLSGKAVAFGAACAAPPPSERGACSREKPTRGFPCRCRVEGRLLPKLPGAF